MKAGYERRLDKSFAGAPVICLHAQAKLVMFSDCHRGAGNANDNFLKNQNAYFAALRHYYDNGFTYIELGDGDELWENRSLSSIREIHGNVFWMLSRFEKQGRLYLLYGNHDRELADCPKSFRSDVPADCPKPLRSDVPADCPKSPHYPGLILKFCDIPAPASEHSTQPRHDVLSESELIHQSTSHSAPTLPSNTRCLEFYLTHGHQAELLNSTLWRVNRFLVRYLWKPLEQFGVLDPTSAAKNYQRRTKSEQRLSHWAIKNDCHLVCGHTHRPMLGNRKTRYFNTGSCVHPRCVTCLEIENAAICLVKWHVEVRADRTLYISRTILAGPLALEEL